MGRIISFPVSKKKYGYEITVSGKRPSAIRKIVGLILFELGIGIMGFEYMIEPIEKVSKDHDSFKVGEG